MSDFQRSLKFTLIYEGGYSNNPNDPGGSTFRGVTQRTYNHYRTIRRKAIQDVRRISQAELEDVYLVNFWGPSGASAVPWPLNFACFDLAVNSGPRRAREFMAEIGEAGTPKERSMRLMMRRRKFFIAIVNHNHRLSEFLRGWFNRCDQLEQLITASSDAASPGPAEGVKTLILNGQTFTAATVSVVGSKIYANGVKKTPQVKS
jgi:lysozyme family protein